MNSVDGKMLLQLVQNRTRNFAPAYREDLSQQLALEGVKAFKKFDSTRCCSKTFLFKHVSFGSRITRAIRSQFLTTPQPNGKRSFTLSTDVPLHDDEIPLGETLPSQNDDPEITLLKKQLAIAITRAVETITVKNKHLGVAVLTGTPARDVAKQYGVSVNTVYSATNYVSIALRKINELKDHT